MEKADKRQHYQTWMTVVYDQSLTIVDVINPMHCMMLRFNENNIIGININNIESLTDSQNKAQASIIAKNVKIAYEEHRNIYFEYATTHTDGSVTYSVCYGEWGKDNRLYVNVIKIDQDNIFEEQTGFTNYYIEAGTKNLSIGVIIRHFSNDGSNRYILSNDIAQEFFEQKDILTSQYWNQESEDLADEKELQLDESLKMEKVIRDKSGNIKRWALLTKKRIKSQMDGFYIITTLIDITKRRQKDILLEKQFSLLDSVYKSLPMGIVLYDKDGELISLNKKDMEIFGVEKKEDVLGINIFDEPNIPQHIKDKIKAGETVEYELAYDFNMTRNYFKSSSTGIKVLAIKTTAILNKDNEADGYLQLCEDITAKRAQEKINNLVYSDIPVGVFIYDQDGMLTSVNKSGRQIMGIPDDVNYSNMSLFDATHIPEHFKKQITEGKNVSYETTVDFDKDSFIFPTTNTGTKRILVKISPIQNHGKTDGYLIIHEDITELATHERQLEKTNIKLNAIFDSLSTGIKVYDKDGYFTDCNEQNKKILGLTDKQGSINNKACIFKSPNIPTKYLDDLRNGKEIRFEQWYDFDIVKEKNYFGTSYTGKKYLEMKCAPMRTSDNEFFGYIFETNDRTETKEQEKQLNQLNERMSMALKAGHVSIWQFDIATQFLSSLGGKALIQEGVSLQKGLVHLHPDDRKLLINTFSALSSGKQDSAATIFRYRDNEDDDYRYYETEMHNQKDSAGNIISIVGTRRDITQKRLREKELSNARKSLNLAMSAPKMLAWDYDTSTKKYRILYGNETLTKPGLLDNCWDNTYPEDHAKYIALTKDLLSGKINKITVIVRVKDKNLAPFFTFEHTVISLKDDSGKVVGLIGVMYDISKQIEYTKELIENRENLNLALAAGKVSAWTYDVSKEFFSTLQGDTLAKDGSTLEENQAILHPDDLELQEKIFAAIISGKEKRASAIFRYRTDNLAGGYRYYESKMVGKTENGVVTNITGTQKDITDVYLHRQALEEQLKRNDLINELCEIVQWDYDMATSILKTTNTKFSMPEFDTNDLSHLLPILHPDDRENVIEFFDLLHKGKNDTIHLEYRVKTDNSNGKYRTFVTDAIAIKDKGGKTIKYSGIDRDMTRWVEMNEKLVQQYATNDLVLNNINSGLIYMNTDRIILWTNINTLHDLTRKLSIGQNEFKVGQQCNFHLSGSDCEEPKKECLFAKSIRTKTMSTQEFRANDNITIETTSIPIFDNDGNVKGILCKIDDITDITRAREDLQKAKDEATLANQILSEIIDKIPCALYIKNYDNEKRFIKANRMFCHEICRTSEEVIGATDYDLFDKVNADLQTSKDDEIIETGGVINYMDEISSFKNRTKYWYITKSAITLSSGDRYTIGIAMDTTDLKESQDEMKKARDEATLVNQILNEIIDKMPCVLYIKDYDNELRFVKANKLFCDYIGHEEKDVIGKTDYDLFEKVNADLQTGNDKKVVETGKVANYMDVISTFGNTTKYWHITKSAITLSSGKRYTIGIGMDVTELQESSMEIEKARDKAINSNKLLNELFAYMPGIIYMKDVSDGLKYSKVNNQFCKFASKSINEVIGKTDEELFGKEIAALFQANDDRLINGEPEISYDKTINIAGKEISFSNTMSLIQFTNGQKMILGLATDTSEIHRIHKELISAKNKAEQSDKLKSKFLANMSHEIRTPLNAIVGFSDLLYDSDDPIERAEYIKIITTNNELLLRLISDILDLSKLESGIIELHNKEFDLAEVFNETYTSFKQKMTASSVKLFMDNPYDECIVNLDKGRLTQVISNFLTNAIKYTPSGHIKMWYRQENNGVKLFVEDTGIGIAKEKYDKVFMRFEKLDDFAQGTGLGLSICKAISEVSHGDIGFTSEAGKGSTFWVWFPTKTEIKKKNKIAESTCNSTPTIDNGQNNRELQTLNILVAEDNDSNYLLVRSILKRHNLSRAINGVKAVEMARKQKFDLILMDVKMPVMDGLEATRLIREFNKDIGIIALTANAFETDKKTALNCGCSAFLAKPIRSRELRATILQIMS